MPINPVSNTGGVPAPRVSANRVKMIPFPKQVAISSKHHTATVKKADPRIARLFKKVA